MPRPADYVRPESIYADTPARLPLPSLYTLVPSLIRPLPEDPTQLQRLKAADNLTDLLDKGAVGKVIDTLLRNEVKVERQTKKDVLRRDREKIQALLGAETHKGDALDVGQGREVPMVVVPESNVPPGFPSGDLLSSIHSHATSLFSANHFLLPPLTYLSISTNSDVLAPEVIEEVNKLRQESAKIEHQLATVPVMRNKVYAKFKEGRIYGAGKGEREGVWTEVERGFDPSALVATAMLLQILAEEHAAGKELVETSIKPVAVEQPRKASPRKLVPYVEVIVGTRRPDVKGKGRASNQDDMSEHAEATPPPRVLRRELSEADKQKERAASLRSREKKIKEKADMDAWIASGEALTYKWSPNSSPQKKRNRKDHLKELLKLHAARRAREAEAEGDGEGEDDPGAEVEDEDEEMGTVDEEGATPVATPTPVNQMDVWSEPEEEDDEE